MLATSKRHCYPAACLDTRWASLPELTSFAFYLTTVLGKSGRPSGKAALSSDLPEHGY